MTEITLAGYLKQLLTPELVVDIITKGDLDKISLDAKAKKVFKEIKSSSLTLKSVTESFVDLIIDLVLIEFLGVHYNYENVYIDVDELDNLFYIIVGVCEKNKIDKACIQNFVRDCVSAIINDKGIKNIIKDYQNKNCNQREIGNRGLGELPKVITPED